MRSSRFLALSRAETVVLCLAATMRPGRADDLSSAVLARLAEPATDVDTVVLAPDGDIDAPCLRDICALRDGLRARGIQLHVVTGTPEQEQQLRALAEGATAASLAGYPSLRSAVLAACAAMPGPGLVNARVHAAMSAPVEQLFLADDEEDVPTVGEPTP